MRGDVEMKSLSKVIDMFAGYGITATVEEDEFAHHDLNVKGEKNNGIAEVKQRYLTVDNFIRYSNEGFMMENYKYNHLKQQRSVYVNYFVLNSLEVILFWDVSKITNKNIKTIYAPKTTSFDNNNYVQKDIILLKIDDASKILYLNEDGWQETNKQKLFELWS